MIFVLYTSTILHCELWSHFNCKRGKGRHKEKKRVNEGQKEGMRDEVKRGRKEEKREEERTRNNIASLSKFYDTVIIYTNIASDKQFRKYHLYDLSSFHTKKNTFIMNQGLLVSEY